MTKAQFLRYLRQQIKLVGTQQDFARKCGISAQYLSDILIGRREPGKKLLDALGMETITFYVDKFNEEGIAAAVEKLKAAREAKNAT